jgi:hypothetical protein
MAVSIDTVYQRVLAVLNKEQRGYLTPEEYNLFANQAQMDIFEQYFYDINQFSRLPGNDTEYSDMLNILNEKISVFEKQDSLVYNNTNSSYDLPTDLYRVGTLIYNGSEVERINKNEYLYITSSPLAAPGNDFPIYTKDEKGFKVYGAAEITANSTVSINYIKKPAKVIWNYVSVLGNAQYNATGSVNFELHPSEESELVLKILALAGLAIQDVGVYQIAAGEESKKQQLERL